MNDSMSSLKSVTGSQFVTPPVKGSSIRACPTEFIVTKVVTQYVTQYVARTQPVTTNKGSNIKRICNGLGEDVSTNIERPMIIEEEVNAIWVNSNKVRITIGNRIMISIERRGKQFQFMIFEKGDDGKTIPYGPHTLDMKVDGIRELYELDIDDELKKVIAHYVSNWDFLREQRVAELLLNGPVRVAPERISEREVLAYEIAEKILENRVMRTFYAGNAVLGLYCFNEAKGVYEECEEEIKAEIVRLVSSEPELSQKTTRWVINEALTKIRELTKKPWRPDLKVLSFNGMILDWETFLATGSLGASVSSPNPDMQVFHYIPHRLALERLAGLEKYYPPKGSEDVLELFKALAPKSYEAFKAWVGEKLVLLLLEIIGYTLYAGGYPLSKIIMLVGDGANGKSTYQKLLKNILGKHNVEAVTLKDLTENRFMVSRLFMKLANISAENPQDVLRNTDMLKKLTGEDLITADRKNKDPIDFVNYAKLIFAVNRLPTVKEDTHAFWRRWIIINFPNKFSEDPGFFRRTFTEEEIEGIIITSLHAFYLVMKRGKFSVPEGHDPKEEWLRRSNSAYRVLKELEEKGVIEFRPDAWVTKDDLFQLCMKYIKKVRKEEEEVIEEFNKKKLTETLEKFFGVRRAKATKQIKNKRPWIYQGVKIANREEYRKIVGQEPETPEEQPQQKTLLEMSKSD